MSHSADPHHLFVLEQILSLDKDDGTICSFDVTVCGRAVVFISDTSADSSETNNGSPCLGSVLLSTATNASDATEGLCTALASSTPLSVSGFRIPWFGEADLRPRCLKLSPEGDFCLIGTENGCLFVLNSKSLIPDFEPQDRDVNHREWAKRTAKGMAVSAKHSKRVFGALSGNGDVVNVPSSRCAHPSSVLWWTTQDQRSMAVVGSLTGWIVIVDLIDGKEVSLSLNFRLKIGIMH